MRFTPTIALAATLTFASACADHAPTDPTTFSATNANLDASPTWASVKTGETGPGAQYAFYMPTAWNGDVVYYAHGIRPASDRSTCPPATGSPPSATRWARRDSPSRTRASPRMAGR